MWKPGWPAKQDSLVSQLISLCSYFYSKNYCARIRWLTRLLRSRLKEATSRLKEATSRLLGWKFLHINTHKQASPVAKIVKTNQNNKIVPASGMNFSHINTREIHPAYRAVSLSGPARLPYKQALISETAR